MFRTHDVVPAVAVLCAAAMGVHCAGSPAPRPESAHPAPEGAGAPAAPQRAPASAHGLLMTAAACWLGGTWSDAFGEADAAKASSVEARCRDLEGRVWAHEHDKIRFEQLRALEANAAADVIVKIDETARKESLDEGTRDALVRFAVAFVEEEKELMLARRAADRVKRDLDREPEKLTSDEVDATAALRAHVKLEGLLTLNAGAYSKEAHALGLLRTLDRVELARGLPKHLKLYAVADEFHFFFRVPIPDVPTDATQKLVPGTWLRFLSETASSAGYPVGDRTTTPRERDALAWAGMLHGFSDLLKTDA
ncbi:MAG TPA: hypothetical protein VKU41_25285, partial [Polyangiaceae bacterium]|nr:hypothetical protein [Polyangiaceae bacterium]